MSNPVSSFDRILGSKNIEEVNSLLDEKTKKVIIHRLQTKQVIIDENQKNILKVLKESLQQPEIAESFETHFSTYLGYACRPINDSIKLKHTFLDYSFFSKKNKEEKVKYLKDILSKFDTHVLNKFYNRLLNASLPSTEIHGKNFETHDFLRMDLKSQKSVALFSLATEILLKHPEYLEITKKEFMKKLRLTLQELLAKIQKIWDYENNFLFQLMNYDMSPVIYMIGHAYIGNDMGRLNYDDLWIEMEEIDDESTEIFEKLYMFFGGENEKIKSYQEKIFGTEIGEEENNQQIHFSEKISSLDGLLKDTPEENIIVPEKISKKFHLPFNCLAQNIVLKDFVSGGQELTKTSYQKLFSSADEILNKVNIKNITNTSVLSVKAKELLPEVTSGEKKWTVYHEWENTEITEKELNLLAKVIQIDEDDFGIKSKEYKPYTKGFKKPFMNSKAEYYGYFKNNSGFEGMHLVLMRNKQDLSKKKLIFSAGEELGIHNHLYYYIQIHYFIEHKKFLPKEVVYTNLYHQLNIAETSGELFDIGIYKEQYAHFIKHLIWPFSKEALQNKNRLPQENIIFAGLPGTGKSQFLQTLLTQKEFIYEQQKLHLNATVVSINIEEFLAMIKSNDFFIQRIYKNTGTPIILVIEDLDTILQNEEEGGSAIVQAITNFLQGVGETPVTLITSTNFLHMFPQRLMRPGRFNSIISFNTILSDDEFIGIVKQHVTINKLDKQRIDIITAQKDHMTYYSASYISKVIQLIAGYIDFSKFPTQGGNTNSLTVDQMNELLNNILDTMIIPIEDIQKADTLYKETLNKMTGKMRIPIGFKK